MTKTIRPPTLSAREGAAVAERCNEAYSWDRYRSWPQLGRRLAARGYTALEIEAALRSKWTRWAADRVSKSHNATAADFIAFLDTSLKNEPRELAELVVGTFGTEAEVCR